MTDLGFVALFPDDLLALLQRVEAGEPAVDVFAEFTMGSDRLDRDGDDEL